MSSQVLQQGPVTYQVTERTDQGLVRQNNEDQLIFAEDRGLFGVCDGMGGHAAGEVASRLASEVLVERVKCTGGDPADSLRDGVQKANNHIFRIQDRNPAYRGMGTTVSALWIAPCGSASTWIVHVGDSRVYRLDKRGLHQLTVDHSPVFRLYQEGVLSKDQMRCHPHKNLLERSLGVLPEIEADVFDTPLTAGDTYLICSDGLTDELSDREIKEVLTQGDLDEIADRLVSQAKATGGRDNISLIVLRILTTPKDSSSSGEPKDEQAAQEASDEEMSD